MPYSESDKGVNPMQNIVNISHKPRRMQADNVRAQPVQGDSFVGELSVGNSKVPASVTIEKAIRYYEENAEGEFEVLYTLTAKWLRDYHSKNLK